MPFIIHEWTSLKESPDILFHFFANLLPTRFRNNAKRSLHGNKIKIVTDFGGREMDNPHLLLKEIHPIDPAFRAWQND